MFSVILCACSQRDALSCWPPQDPDLGAMASFRLPKGMNGKCQFDDVFLPEFVAKTRVSMKDQLPHTYPETPMG